jgi:predicted ATPase
MISKVSIRNFKCLRDVQIDLERFTAFVGPNVSGKSSILQALNFLSRLFQGQEGLLEGELSQALSRAANDNVELAAECAGKGYRYRSRFPFPPSASWSGTGRGVAVELTSADWEHWMPSQTNKMWKGVME